MARVDQVCITDGWICMGDAARVRSVAELSLPNVVRRFAAASEISELIGSAIAQPGVLVSYVGHGRFEVSGVISEAVRQRLNL